MRAILITLLVVIVAFGLFWALKPQAPSDLSAAKIGDAVTATTTPAAATSTPDQADRQVSLSSFSFTGYGPGKERVGKFKEADLSNVAFSADGVPVSGTLTIKTASVDTGIDGLDKHLCGDDFFDCAANPEIVFNLTSIAPPAGTSTEYTVSGTLTFNGVTQAISFPATVSGTETPTFAADFKFDTTFFNFKYVGIDKEVRIQFSGEIR